MGEALRLTASAAALVGAVRARCRRARVAAAALAALASLGVSFAAAPAALADVEASINVGHGDRWVADASTPVIVTLRSRESQPVSVEIELVPSSLIEGADVRLERSVTIAPGALRQELFLLPGPDQYGSSYTVRVRTTPSVPVVSGDRRGDRGELQFNSGSRTGSSSPAPYGCHAIAVLGDPRAFAVLRERLPGAEVTTLAGTALAERIDVLDGCRAAIPYAPLAFDGIETIILADPDSELVATEREAEALLDWVALGGRLVVSLGDNAAQFASSPLAAEMPGAWGRTEQADYLAIADAFGVVWPADQRPARAVGTRVPLTARPENGARGDAGAGVLSRRFGNGQIVLLGFDLRSLLLPPHPKHSIAKRIAPGLLWETRKAPVSQDGAEIMREEMRTTEPLGQLLRGSAFRPPPAVFIFLGLVLYVLVVGPLDWMILRRMKKERWTTVTFVGAVVVFTLIAYVASFFLFGADRQTQRIVFVELAESGRPGRELVRVRDLAGHYEPIGGSRSLSAAGPTVFLGSVFPTCHEVPGVGARLPMRVRGADPASVQADVNVAFRSQRVVSTLHVGTTGRTLELIRDAGGHLILTNGLPVDITDAWILPPDGQPPREFGAIRAGGSAAARTGRPPSSDPQTWDTGEVTDIQRTAFLARVAAPAAFPSLPPPERFEGLDRAGISAAELPRGRALIFAFAAASPFPLSDQTPGPQYVVITREVDLP